MHKMLSNRYCSELVINAYRYNFHYVKSVRKYGEIQSTVSKYRKTRTRKSQNNDTFPAILVKDLLNNNFSAVNIIQKINMKNLFELVCNSV